MPNKTESCLLSICCIKVTKYTVSSIVMYQEEKERKPQQERDL